MRKSRRTTPRHLASAADGQVAAGGETSADRAQIEYPLRVRIRELEALVASTERRACRAEQERGVYRAVYRAHVQLFSILDSGKDDV